MRRQGSRASGAYACGADQLGARATATPSRRRGRSAASGGGRSGGPAAPGLRAPSSRLGRGRRPGSRRRAGSLAHELAHRRLRGRLVRVDRERPRRARARRRIVPRAQRDPREADDGDRVPRVGLGDLAEEALGGVEHRRARARSAASSARSSVLGQHRLGQQQQRRPVVEARVGDRPARAARRGSGPSRGPAGRPSSAIRSSPWTARSRRSSTTDAASSASTRARSSSSACASAGTPLPMLSASRSANRSSIASTPTRWMNRRTPASPHSGRR